MQELKQVALPLTSYSRPKSRARSRRARLGDARQRQTRVATVLEDLITEPADGRGVLRLEDPRLRVALLSAQLTRALLEDVWL